MTSMLNKKFRKQNITGIKKLSIGTTKNGKGEQMTRYCVNHKVNDKYTSKSFYFGSNNSQIEAFQSAVQHMIDCDIYSGTLKNALNIYQTNNHKNL